VNTISAPTNYFDVVLLQGMPATCFGHLCGHLQENINENAITITKPSAPFHYGKLSYNGSTHSIVKT
jgi:hypothetical protein